MKKAIIITIATVSFLIIVVIIVAAVYICRSKTYTRRQIKKLTKAGYIEKQVTLPDSTVINYGEGPDNGIPLFLIHGQQADWKDYAPVLPELAKHFHVYAVDCYGHGKSSKDASKYYADAIGNDFIWFIKNIIRQPVIISGHSSGGLLAAWITANAPQQIRGAVLEDPPLFSTEPDAAEKTFAWQDFKTMYEFSVQSEEKDYVVYMIKHSGIQKLIPENIWKKVSNRAINIRRKNPDKKVFDPLAPRQMNLLWEMISGPYDYRFGINFYNFSWFRDFNQTETLKRINRPVILIHNTANYSKDGTLLAAMSNENAQKAQALIRNSKIVPLHSGHDSHVEKPKEFINIVLNFSKEIK